MFFAVSHNKFSTFHFLKETLESEEIVKSVKEKEPLNGEEKSDQVVDANDPGINNKKQISVMDPIDTVFKIVNLAPAPPGNNSSLNVPGQQQSSNGSLINPDTGGIKNQAPSMLSKSRTSEWFANLFSPSKSRTNSSSTDTSRFVFLVPYKIYIHYEKKIYYVIVNNTKTKNFFLLQLDPSASA